MFGRLVEDEPPRLFDSGKSEECLGLNERSSEVLKILRLLTFQDSRFNDRCCVLSIVIRAGPALAKTRRPRSLLLAACAAAVAFSMAISVILIHFHFRLSFRKG